MTTYLRYVSLQLYHLQGVPSQTMPCKHRLLWPIYIYYIYIHKVTVLKPIAMRGMNTETRSILDLHIHYGPEYMALYDWKFPLPNTTTVMLLCIFP
jgi:hypothetical protein